MSGRVELVYDMPLADVVYEFYDTLKSVSRGYASFDYEVSGYRASRLVRLDILLNGRPVDALAQLVFSDNARQRAYEMCRRLKDEIPRHQFKVADPGRRRQPDHRPRNRFGGAQGRYRQVLRRRHHAQAQTVGAAEGGQEADEADRRRAVAQVRVSRGAQAGRGLAVRGVGVRMRLAWAAPWTGVARARRKRA